MQDGPGASCPAVVAEGLVFVSRWDMLRLICAGTTCAGLEGPRVGGCTNCERVSHWRRCSYVADVPVRSQTRQIGFAGL